MTMPDRSPSNPYLDEPLAELSASCHKAAAHLQGTSPASPMQERLSLLLIAAGTRLLPTEVWGSRPESARDSRQFDELLADQHQQRLREIRYRTLALAAEHYLGQRAHNWLRDARIEGLRLYDVALASEQGLQQALSAVKSAAA